MKADWETVKCYILANDDIPQQKPVETVVNAIPHRLRRLYLSAYQAHLFNRILEKRMPHLGKLRDGDIAVKHSNGAPFLVEHAIIEQPRADAFEISPSGPIFGYKMRMPSGDVRDLEISVLADDGVRLEKFRKVAGIRLPGTRRPLRMPIQRHEVSTVGNNAGIRLSFTLPAGGYATVVLEELLANLPTPK